MHDEARTLGLYSGEKRHRLILPRLEVTYAWMRPFEGASTTLPNRLEVVFSRHKRVALQQAGKAYDVDVQAGGFFVIGSEPTTLLSVQEHSDTLEMYPDMDLLRSVTEGGVALHPTLGRTAGQQHFGIDAVMLGFAHVLRQMCLGLRSQTPIEVSSIEHMIAVHVTGARLSGRMLLSAKALRRVVDHVEETLEASVTLEDLAAEACLSPYHFARAFRRSTGLPPHRFVLARKMEHAKNRLLTTKSSVAGIAASLGFENLHHFRRQFRTQFGVQPGHLRRIAGS